MYVKEKSSNEMRLIDANELCRKFEGEPWYDNADLDEIALPLVDDAPTVDAVEVIRCRECKHCDPENHHCDHPMSTSAPLSRKPDDFCSYGERKDDEHEH